MSAKIVPFDELLETDLIVDAIYLGGTANNAADDPLNRLTRCGNMGGFRKVGRKEHFKYVVLYSSQSDRNWPDHLDPATGLFTYYGDNKTPGSQLHDTTRGGNRLLAHVFDRVHAFPSQRSEVPPFFIFTKADPYGRRAVQFRGLAAPGANGVAPTDDLVAVWKSTQGYLPRPPSARTGSGGRLAPLGRRCSCYHLCAHFLLPPGAPLRPLATRLGTLQCRTTWISFAGYGSRFLYT